MPPRRAVFQGSGFPDDREKGPFVPPPLGGMVCRGAFCVAQAVAPRMLARRYGRVIVHDPFVPPDAVRDAGAGLDVHERDTNWT